MATRQALHGRRGEAEVIAHKRSVSFPRSAGIQGGRLCSGASLDTRLRGYERDFMPCVLGLDIGTTSTIGILIRPPDETLALASRPGRPALGPSRLGRGGSGAMVERMSARSCANFCARAALRRPISPRSA